MSGSPIKFDIKDRIATLTINRPEARNSLNDETIQRIIDCLFKIEVNEEIIAVIIRGEGKHFCSGADIKWARQTSQFSNEENSRVTRALANMLHKFHTLKKPTISIAQGAVYGGGIGFIACSDIVFALPDTTFCFAEVKLGLVPAVISPYVISVLGEHIAKRYILTAEPFSAHRAYELGLVHDIIPADDLEKKIAELILRLQKNGPKAMQIAKTLLNQLTEEHKTLEANMIHTSNLLASLCVSKEGQEGLAAFLEKRSPSWFKPNETP